MSRKTRKVLEWLRQLLAWCNENPEERLNETLKEIVNHKKEITDAILDAMEPEIKEYILEKVNNLG